MRAIRTVVGGHAEFSMWEYAPDGQSVLYPTTVPILNRDRSPVHGWMQ